MKDSSSDLGVRLAEAEGRLVAASSDDRGVADQVVGGFGKDFLSGRRRRLPQFNVCVVAASSDDRGSADRVVGGFVKDSSSDLGGRLAEAEARLVAASSEDRASPRQTLIVAVVVDDVSYRPAPSSSL